MDIARVHDEPALQARVQVCEAVPMDDWDAVRKDLAPLLLDPADFCAQCGTSRAATADVQGVCAA